MKKFNKGSKLDTRPADQEEGTWRRGRNIVNYKAFGSIANENGADNITPIAVTSTNYKNFPTKPVIGITPTNKGTIFCFAPSVAGNDSEIGFVDTLNRYTPKLKDVAGRIVLDFSLNSPIQGTYEYKFNNNLIFAWRDSKNNPRILNLDCFPFDIDSSFNVVAGDLAKAKALIKLFPDLKSPNITDLTLSDNGGTLKTGTYFPIVSYELEDKSVTSWLRVYNPFPVVQDSSTLAFTQYDGDASDISTSKKLNLAFSDIDVNYANLRFGVIILKAGVYTAYYVSSNKINGTTLNIEYTGSENTISPITLDEVLIPNAIYTKAGTITNLLGQLYLGDVEVEEQPDFQQYANLINVDWIRGTEITLDGSQSESYKDEKIVFFNKSFRSGEVVALYIAFKLKSGGYTDAFHIPGRAPLTGDTAVISGTGDAQVDLLGSTVKKFQVRETALIDGTMGYWENDSEVYPNTDEFNSTSLGGLDLRNLPVRHHKFPEISTIIKETGEAYFKKFTQVGGSLILADPITNDATPFVGTSVYEFILGTNTTSLVYNQLGTVPNFVLSELESTVVNRIIQLRGDIVYSLTGIQSSGAGSTITITIAVTGNDAAQYWVDVTTITYAMTGGTGNYSGTIPYNKYWALFAVGDVFSVTLTAAINHASVVLDFTGTEITVTEGTYTAEARPLGIRLSNITVPTAIADKVDGYEIFYAKRTGNNIRIIGQDVLKEDRLHSFDLVYNQSNLRADYIKPQILFQRNSLTSLSAAFNNYVTGLIYEFTTEVFLDDLTHISEFFYLGENVLLPIDNTGKSTSIYAGTFSVDWINVLFDICIYRKDVYKGFDTQTLVSTGTLFKITASGAQASQDLYGGDTFISAYGFIENTSAKNEYLIPHESAANIGLRMDDEINSKYYYPKHLSTDLVPPTISYYGYNSDYTALNDLNKVFPRATNFSDCIRDVFDFDYLVVFSVTDGSESSKLNWRIFPINNYYDELPKDKGRVWNLLGANRVLYIQQEYALLIASVKDKLNVADGEVALATSSVFDRPPVELIPTTEGYIGGQSQFGILLCPYGYLTIDRQQGRIFLINGTDIKEISLEGYYDFFRKNTQTTDIDVDNPYIGNGYTTAYDAENKRIIIVKKDTDNEFTISYCGDTKSWMGEHDYHPNYIFSTRSGLYAGVNSNFKLYKLNSRTLKGVFFDGVMYNSYIEAVFNKGQDITKTFANFNWITNVIALDGVVKDNETLTGLVVYNDTQCSGEIDLQADNGLWFGNDARNTEKTWNYNNFRDLVKDKTLKFLDSNNEVITSNINTNKAWFDKSKFVSKFVIVRFIYNNVNQRDLFIVSVDSNMRQSKR